MWSAKVSGDMDDAGEADGPGEDVHSSALTAIVSSSMCGVRSLVLIV